MVIAVTTIQNGQTLGFGTLVRLAPYTGLRWSELARLRVRDIDPSRGRLHVTHTVVEVGGYLHEGDPKSYEARAVSIPPFVLQELRRQADGATSRCSSARLVAPGYATEHSGEAWLTPAAAAIEQPGLTPHELGHTSAEVTLNVYSDLFDDDLGDVATRLDHAAGR